MADDERRAEIEAATDALLADSGLPRYGGHRATIERRMVIAFDAADRVRDARGDDEVRIVERDAPLLEVVRGPYAKALARIAELEAQLAARSPQGEDHE